MIHPRQPKVISCQAGSGASVPALHIFHYSTPTCYQHLIGHYPAANSAAGPVPAAPPAQQPKFLRPAGARPRVQGPGPASCAAGFSISCCHLSPVPRGGSTAHGSVPGSLRCPGQGGSPWGWASSPAFSGAVLSSPGAAAATAPARRAHAAHRHPKAWVSPAAPCPGGVSVPRVPCMG